MLFDFSDDLQLSFFFPFEHASLRGHPVHGPLLCVNVRYMYLERPNNQNQSEIFKRKPLIVSLF